MLSTVSVEYLKVILAFLESQQIGALWLCGDRELNLRLSQAVTKLEVELWPWLPMVWPHLVTSLSQLKDLRVSIYKVTLPDVRNLPKIGHFDWSVVPKTLSSLSLAFQFPLQLVLPLMPHLESLRVHCNTLSKENDPVEVFPDFASSTPQLKSLIWHQEGRFERSILSLDLARLPPGLTDLSGSFVDVIMAGKRWPSLTRLHIKVNFSDEWFSQLPSTLTDLKLQRSHHLAYDWTHLPKLQHIWTKIDCAWLPKLPRCLISLGRIQYNSAGLCSLPPHLTSLEAQYITLMIDAKMAASLPRTLTSIKGLSFYFSPDTISETASHLPPHLEYTGLLKWWEGPLPKELKTYKHLTALLIPGNIPEGIENLPSTLQRFVCNNLTIEHITQLPSSLKSLYVGEIIPEAEFALLPRGLTRLETSPATDLDLRCPLPHSIGLPHNLVEISLHRCIISDLSWFSELPGTLTRLKFEEILEISSFTSSTLAATESRQKSFNNKKKKKKKKKKDGANVEDVISPMPPGITKLKIPLGPNLLSDAYLAVLQRLPRHLIFLDMSLPYPRRQLKQDPDITGFRNKDMALLPRGLITAHFPRCDKLTAACMTFLPPHMDVLDCGGEELLAAWSKKQKRA